MSFTTFSLTPEGMKSDESDPSAWQGYRNSSAMPTRILPSYGHTSLSPLGSSYGGVSGNGFHIMPNLHHLSPRIKTHPTTMPRPHLKSHHSYPSLKRSYQAFEEAQYSEVVPEFYDTLPNTENHQKPTTQPDHRLLSFGQTQRRHTILDQYGRPGNMEIAAQIHGMFFLSEIATNSGDAIIIQPELTCYRRNLFQISGSVTGPAGPVSVLTEHGQTVPIVAQELSICATESVDGHVIRLIVIPWKTPPPNSPEVPLNQEQEPPPIPLLIQGDGVQEINNDVTVHPIAWRRLQFRVATANNGRRKELQQHFVLRLNLTATLDDNTKLCIAEATTAPIVVRGRSPRNFQARKEIPLVGSSASPRGQTAQSSLAEKKVQPEKLQSQKQQISDLPKRPLQFHTTNFPQSPVLLRQGNFNQWNTSQQQSEEATDTTTPSYTPPQTVPQSYVHKGRSSSEATHLLAPAIPQSQTPVTEGTIQQQFYQIASEPTTSSLSVPFVDSNPRPSKSARHSGASDISAMSLYQHYDERAAHPYSALSQADDSDQTSREYYPVTLGPGTWSTAENGHIVYGTTTIPHSQPHFSFSSQSFLKDEALPGHYTWSAA